MTIESTRAGSPILVARPSPSGRESPTLVSTSVAVPRFDPLSLFVGALRAGHEPTLWLQPSAGLAMLGVGRAWEAAAAGPDRFETIARSWRRLIAGAHCLTQAGEGVRDGTGPGVNGSRSAAGAPGRVGPILLGGLGFSGDVPADPIWQPFGASSMALPELLGSCTPHGAWLSVSFVPAPDVADRADGVERLLSRWTKLTAQAEALEAGRAEPSSEPALPTLTPVAAVPDRRTWDRLVAQFAGAVGRGRLDKVVLARRVDLESAGAIDVGGVLRRLVESAPDSTVYAVARGGAVFLGATPERLVLVRGREFETAAVAGSIRRGASTVQDATLAAELLASEKDREEHAVVVRMIRQALTPVAESISVADSPVVLPFRTIQHLVTRISGRIREPEDILSLAARLHPTPAVGGTPSELALQLIAEHEGFDRGWYAGPLGWIGPDGDGELVVALRCGVIRGSEASLFAGCGIVADSDAAAEWEESRLKLRALASVLGEIEL